MLNCIRQIRKRRECRHEWQVFYVYLPAMRIKCIRCNKKKTVTFSAFGFVRYWLKPYAENPELMKRCRKTIEFFQTNKATIIKSATEEIQKRINAIEKEKRELKELKQFCEASATAFL